MMRSLPETASTGLMMLFGILMGSFLLGGCSAARPYRVAGNSMLPSLHEGDRIFVDESEPARSDLRDGEIVAFRHGEGIVVKRIIGMPGETIRGEHGKVFRNGRLIDEPYLAPATGEDIPEMTTFAPVTVKPGELFVLGDNRDLSLDSRAAEYGPVQFTDVVGRYSWTYWRAASAPK